MTRSIFIQKEIKVFFTIMCYHGLYKVSTLTILVVLLALTTGAVADPGPENYMLNVVQASEILSIIESGAPVNVSRAKIIGDLSIYKSNLSSLSSGRARPEEEHTIFINIPVKIIDSEIQGSVDFSNVVFSNTIQFTETIFEKNVKFEGTLFNSSVDFRGAQFDEGAYFGIAEFLDVSDFSACQFRKITNFNSAQFSNSAEFGEAQFDGGAYFVTAKFLDGADFGACQFRKIANFDSAQFSNYAYFSYSKFNGDAQFADSQFNRDAYFSVAQFENESNFEMAHFSRDVYFKDARFKKIAKFEKSQFDGYALFSQSIFDKDAHFRGAHFGGVSDFSNVEFNTNAYFENTQFNDSFYLSNSKFNRLHIHWSSIEDKLVYNGPAYLDLIKNFENLEEFNDADKCYYQFRRIIQADEDLGWSKVGDVLAWLSCGYGVRPGYTVAWCFVLIIFFGIILWAGKGLQEDSDYAHTPKKSLDTIKQKNKKKLYDVRDDAYSVKLLESIYLSAIVFFHTYHPRCAVPSKEWSKWLILVEDIIGWLLLALFLVALANVIVR